MWEFGVCIGSSAHPILHVLRVTVADNLPGICSSTTSRIGQIVRTVEKA